MWVQELTSNPTLNTSINWLSHVSPINHIKPYKPVTLHLQRREWLKNWTPPLSVLTNRAQVSCSHSASILNSFDSRNHVWTSQLPTKLLSCFLFLSDKIKDDNWAGSPVSGLNIIGRVGPGHIQEISSPPRARLPIGRPAGGPRAAHGPSTWRAFGLSAGFRSPRDWMERKSDLNPDQAPGPPPRLGLHQPDGRPTGSPTRPELYLGQFGPGLILKLHQKAGPNPVGFGRPVGHPAQLSSLDKIDSWSLLFGTKNFYKPEKWKGKIGSPAQMLQRYMIW
jgi:hypothetical protein